LLQRAAQPVLLLALVAGTLGVAAASPRNTLRTPYGPVRIARDAIGVPHIRAHSEAGAQFGLGYAHAQDRLWQMEWQRRLASGRTAEFLGNLLSAADPDQARNLDTRLVRLLLDRGCRERPDLEGK